MSPAARVELLPSSPDLDGLPERATTGYFEDFSHDEFAIFWPSRQAPKPFQDEQWDLASLNVKTGIVGAPVAGQDHLVVSGRLLGRSFPDIHGRRSPSSGTAAPYCCPSCGIEYSLRKADMRLSPIRSFRTGFGKTSQLVATELFESLRLSGTAPKAVVFSDSRQMLQIPHWISKGGIIRICVVRSWWR